MILVASFLVVVASVPLTGGQLHRLLEVRIRRPALIVASLGVQVLIVNLFPHALSISAASAVHLVTYVVAAVFLWVNRHVPGLWIAAVGGGMNFAAIAANGGVMPASRWALDVAGLDPVVDGFTNSTAVDGARLALLGDIFAVPAWLPLSNVFSIGDILLVVGAGVLLHRCCGRVAAEDQTPVGATAEKGDAGRPW